MAKVDAAEEVARATVETQGTQILIGVPGPVDVTQLAAAAADALAAAQGTSRGRFADGVVGVAFPGATAGSAGSGSAEPEIAGGVRLLPYEPHGAANAQLSWMPQAGAYEALFALAAAQGASVCAVLHPDLKACVPEAVEALIRPVLNGECDLVMPIYPARRFEGLLNLGILEPLARALYGRRLQTPLAPDFAVSGNFAKAMQRPTGNHQPGAAPLLWPGTEAVVRERSMAEAYLPVHHDFSAEGVDLSTILTQILGPLFADTERYAAVWQRVRGSHAVVVHGTPFHPAGDDHAEEHLIDPKPMIETFQLGQRNLQEVWSLVLPPVTLLELKRLGRQTPETFKMPDDLWAKIMYDFVLAHRLRTIGRNHLLGALTPLYLGWVASYVREAGGASESELGERRERLQRAFEETKPYLLQRWRWPDRFNP